MLKMSTFKNLIIIVFILQLDNNFFNYKCEVLRVFVLIRLAHKYKFILFASYII